MASQHLTFRVAYATQPGDPALLELDGRHTLHDLHHAIQDAFGWDDDHLYSFFMSGRPWDAESEYTRSPEPGSSVRQSAQARLERLGLAPGAEFLYLFDYGDDHHFTVRVEAITQQPKPLKQAVVERRPAQPPAQYDDDWDDEDEDGTEQPPTEEQSLYRRALTNFKLMHRLQALMGERDDDSEYDWGGDGSELNETVRAHVEAALVETDAPYPPPLDALLKVGDARKEIDYEELARELGLTQEHVPDLVRMARDRALNIAMSDTDEVWAPIHALFLLQYLDISAVVSDLIPLFDVDTDWFGTHLPDVLKHAGAAALDPLALYLNDETRWNFGRTGAAEAIQKVGEQPELRERAIQILSDLLARGNQNDDGLNGSLVASLVDLKAVEALPVLRQVHEDDAVDITVNGDWEAVLQRIGIEPEPDDPLVAVTKTRLAERPLFRNPLLQELVAPLGQMALPPTHKPGSHSTEKAKRKMANTSRKANKHKKKRK